MHVYVVSCAMYVFMLKTRVYIFYFYQKKLFDVKNFEVPFEEFVYLL